MDEKNKIRITRNDLLVYAVTGAVLFNLVQLTLYGIYRLSGPHDSESILQGVTYMASLILSIPGGYICYGLGLEHARIPGISFLINGLVGAFLFTVLMAFWRFIRDG